MAQSSYRVTIAGVTGTAPKDGFIDNTTVEVYVANGSAAPTTYVQTVAKARGNARYKFLQQQLQIDANVYVADIVAAAGSATSQPTSFVFTAVVERGNDVLFTRDENNAGAALTGTDAIKRWVARSLILGRTVNATISDPTAGTAPGNTTPYARRGARTEALIVGPLAANLTDATALVTVTPL